MNRLQNWANQTSHVSFRHDATKRNKQQKTAKHSDPESKFYWIATLIEMMNDN